MGKRWVGLFAVALGMLTVPSDAIGASLAAPEAGGKSNRALVFLGTPGEANDLTLSVSGEDGDYLELRLLDAGAAVEARENCRGGGAPGVAVECRIRKPSEDPEADDASIAVVLGDGGSRFDASRLVTVSGYLIQIPIEVFPGRGEDEVVTGGGGDVIHASAGNDTIHTEGGDDVYLGGPTPDGADEVDLGGSFGEDLFDYRERSASVFYTRDGVADDGARGEGDKLLGAEEFNGGTGDDVLVGGGRPMPVIPVNDLNGGPGDDLLRGGDYDDILRGGSGNDRVYGEAGRDVIFEPRGGSRSARSGNDFADGGSGPDTIELGGGEDTADGGADEDVLLLGPGEDVAEPSPGHDTLLGEAGDDRLDGGEGADEIVGSEGHDILLGGAGGDRILAGVLPTIDTPWVDLFHTPGPLENRRDQVDCGDGPRDRAGVDPVDAVSGCELAFDSRMIELLQFRLDSTGVGAAQLSYEVRAPGIVTLTASGLRPQRRRDHARFDFVPHYLPIEPVGWAKRRLNRGESIELHYEIALHSGGRVYVRHAKLELPG